MKHFIVFLFVFAFSCNFESTEVINIDSPSKNDITSFDIFKLWLQDSSQYYCGNLKLNNPNAYYYSEISSDSSSFINVLSFNRHRCLDIKSLNDEILINLIELLKLNDFEIHFPFDITFEYTETIVPSVIERLKYDKDYVIDELQIIKHTGMYETKFALFLNKGNLISVDSITIR
ncbi:hypothetical protein [Polluticaenibacter yanchengensis]|uniref:Lipoprotein n=1 Tax=Polluticaenibacter yanchengensis TaxID=3014562 RepID=A0ABT4UFA7_9BACT|nr:hypothetical protein [Chitinophagaceae bacterium LY-5]